MCFSDVMFPLLARMRGGLYFNTYIVSYNIYELGLWFTIYRYLVVTDLV